jgi:hypothetical protein
MHWNRPVFFQMKPLGKCVIGGYLDESENGQTAAVKSDCDSTETELMQLF